MSEISKVSYGGGLLDIRDKVFGLRGAGIPGTSVKGEVGQLYEDTANGKLYICTAVNGNTYTWEESGAKIPLYTSTGQATDGAMTQKAVSNELANKASNTAFIGSTPYEDGAAGLVPKPRAWQYDMFLRADGTWGVVPSGVNVVQETGSSTEDVMSQDATTKAVNGKVVAQIIEWRN